ncbi:ATP-binding protein [Halomonas sp. M4R5S39]|uniref:ATP-binding protein n=1 Tax=Halomonas kalidii TaxID=3043293 RepID=UPI0024A9E051|nr:hybrid sensor histidine kinase/response regulator [Halomonas kalidii]MDI5985569.1 ATP-binding protein [Halomonas kalidii]
MSLKNRLFVLLLGLPLLLLSGLTGIALHLESEHRRQVLHERLATAVDLLAPELNAALAEEDHPALETVAGRLLDLEEIRAVGIRDATGTPRLELGRLRAAPLPVDEGEVHLDTDGSLWRLQAPLSAGAADRPTPTWLELDIDAMPLVLDHYRRLASAGLGLLVAGLLLWLIAYITSRRLIAPVQAADRALERLANGDHPPPLTCASPPELARLAERVNALSDHLDHARDEVQRQIEQTTAELQESMETIEVQNIELDMAHRRALEASRIKSEFLANMSHEIRTPLNGIIGFCRLLGRSRLEPRQREWLDHVHRACDNLLMLVNDVLDFSKLEAGRLELEHVPLDMVMLVDEVLALQAPQAHQKDLQLIGLVYDDVPVTLSGDPLRIRQVLTNLVNNAIKFTERGEVIVRVMVEQAEPGRVTLRVSVSDTGIGLSPESRQRLFQAFRQADPSHSREFGGTGLGLTICRQLVEQMGGEIGVESEPGEGSTFAFTLALEGDESRERPPELQLSGETVLLDEPHPATRRALHHLLTRWGARVIDAGQPPNRECSPALLVAGLPHQALDAAGLATWQRRLDTIACPALLLANTSPLDLPLLVPPRGGEVLSKPLSRVALMEAVQRQLGGDLSPTRPASGAEAEDETGPLRLLVVDDTESNRVLLRELIQRPGIEVELAASGEEALAMAQERRYAMVLMDIRMPGMDGVETTRALRRLQGAWNHLPIIAVTAHVLENERQRLLANGLDDVLIKPLAPQDLAELLQQHLDLPALPLPEADATPPAQTADDGELAVVDLDLGTRLAGGREPLARELLARLSGSLQDSEREIREALERQDDEALLDAIHALNGACRYCGAPRLALLAETLETRLRSRGREGVTPLLDDLFAAMAGLRDWQANQPSSTTKATASSASSVNDK